MCNIFCIVIKMTIEETIYEPEQIDAALRKLREVRLPNALEGQGMNGEEFAVLALYLTDIGKGSGYITIPRVVEVLGFSGQNDVVSALEVLAEAKLLKKTMEQVGDNTFILNYEIERGTRDLRKMLDRLTPSTQDYIDTKDNAVELRLRIGYAKRLDGIQPEPSK